MHNQVGRVSSELFPNYEEYYELWFHDDQDGALKHLQALSQVDGFNHHFQVADEIIFRGCYGREGTEFAISLLEDDQHQPSSLDQKVFLADLYLYKGLSGQRKLRAHEIYSAHCKENKLAAFGMGFLSHEGIIMPLDKIQAMDYFKHSMKMGHVLGGVCHYQLKYKQNPGMLTRLNILWWKYKIYRAFTKNDRDLMIRFHMTNKISSG